MLVHCQYMTQIILIFKLPHKMTSIYLGQRKKTMYFCLHTLKKEVVAFLFVFKIITYLIHDKNLTVLVQ